MKIYQKFFMLICSLAVLSMAVDAIDFTSKDIDGKTHHLFEYLNNGKYVLLLFSSPSSG